MAFHGFIAGTPRADQQAQGMEMLSDAKMKAVRWLQVYHSLQRFKWYFFTVFLDSGSYTYRWRFLLCVILVGCYGNNFSIRFVKSCWNRWNSWCLVYQHDIWRRSHWVWSWNPSIQVAIRFGQGVVRCVGRTDTSAGVRRSSGGRSFDGVPALSLPQPLKRPGPPLEVIQNYAAIWHPPDFPSQQKPTKSMVGR